MLDVSHNERNGASIKLFEWYGKVGLRTSVPQNMTVEDALKNIFNIYKNKGYRMLKPIIEDKHSVVYEINLD